MPPAVSPERQRHDHLAAEFIAFALVDMHRRGGFDRREIGPEQQRQRGQTEQCPRPAEPARAADIFGQIRRQIEPREAQGSPFAPLAVAFGKGIEAAEHDPARIVQNLGVRKLGCGKARPARAAGFLADLRLILRLEQTRPPCRLQAPIPGWDKRGCNPPSFSSKC